VPILIKAVLSSRPQSSKMMSL